MTGKERLLTSLNRKEPDHAHTLEWVLVTNVIEEIYDTRSPIDFAFKADLDGLAVSPDYKNEVLEAHEDGNLKPVVEDLIGAGISAKNWKYFLEIRKELGQYPLNIELLERIAQGG